MLMMMMTLVILLIILLHHIVGAILGSRVSTVLSAYRNDPHLSFLFQGKEDFRPKLSIDELMKSDEVKEHYGHHTLNCENKTPVKNVGNVRDGPIRVRKSLSELLCSKSPSFASAVMRSSIRSASPLLSLFHAVTRLAFLFASFTCLFSLFLSLSPVLSLFL